jgi:signal transduction histidine kinase/DNA-binding response OmpR family regulator/CHASE3 domain sensor protein
MSSVPGASPASPSPGPPAPARASENRAADDAARSVARRLGWAVLAPVVVLLLLGGGLAYEVSTLIDEFDAARDSRNVVAEIYSLQKRIVDQETGLRGFLLGNDRLFLEPYQKADVEGSLRRLRELFAGDTAQQERLRELTSLHASWLVAARQAITAPENERRDPRALIERKRWMDGIRSNIAAMLDPEERRVDERSRQAQETGRAAMWIFAGLIGVSAIMLSAVSRRQIGGVAAVFGEALTSTEAARAVASHQQWLRTGEAELAAAVVGKPTVAEVAQAGLDHLLAYLGASVGTVFASSGGGLDRVAASGVAGAAPVHLASGEGLVGRVAAQKAALHTEVPAGYLTVGSSTGAAPAGTVLLEPVLRDGTVLAVIELGFLGSADRRAGELLGRAAPILASALASAHQQARIQELLSESQAQAEELQAQQEELRVSNEELEQQRNALRDAYERQREVQAELEASNSHLEEQSNLLSQQKASLVIAQSELAAKADDLARASRYKSEFLANMSHELRTPLNSSLILARLLADNADGNLTAEQVQFAETIYASGNDLLHLISDILDLARIEAGRLRLIKGNVALARVSAALVRTFEPVAAAKGLAFAVVVDPGAPEVIETDEGRLLQILKNLVANACKFTEQGAVTVRVQGADDRVIFTVEDTGIGIAEHQQALIFEAFRQADGGASRKYGGTGLGLAISRDLATRLGGTLEVASEPGRGSTFTLTLPRTLADVDEDATAAAPSQRRTPVRPEAQRPSPPATPPAASPLAPAYVPDDREVLTDGSRRLLVIEDDPEFAKILIRLGQGRGFQCLAAGTADEGIALAERFRPDGILLDIQLPDHSGLSVLERLKRRPATRHIPVHMMSVADLRQRAGELGAVGYLLKPGTPEDLQAAILAIEQRIAPRQRRVLLVEDDPVQQAALVRFLAADDVDIVATSTVAGALGHLGTATFDCVVTDLALEDGTGFDLLERMGSDDRVSFPPVIVYTGAALSEADEQRLRRFSSSIIVKGARSPERLLDEVNLFLHQVEAELPPDRRKLLHEVRAREAAFEGKTVLIVEDDVRNVFALSRILEPKGLRTVIARNGVEALAALDTSPQIDLVLMDIMMPEMDGLEATRRIRQDRRWERLPVIALTAKAMRDDRERCLAAGASDYLAKPVDVDMLLSLLRVWMPR